jgi:4-hydroxy-3-methylbut-2-enyl diphosphate reductase IspH
VTEARNWWPTAAHVVFGVTAGASTPNVMTGAVFRRLFELAGVGLEDLLSD